MYGYISIEKWNIVELQPKDQEGTLMGKLHSLYVYVYIYIHIYYISIYIYTYIYYLYIYMYPICIRM